MILVDILVPAMESRYDFQLDEDSSIYNIIAEIGELISQKEHCNVSGDPEALVLCTMSERKLLSVNSTLRECGIRTGDSLILV